MKKTRRTLLLLLLCVTLLTACGQTPSVPDESVPQDVSVSSTTTTEITTTTEETTTTTEETTTTTAVETTTTEKETTTAVKTTIVKATTTTTKKSTTKPAPTTTTTTAKPTTTTTTTTVTVAPTATTTTTSKPTTTASTATTTTTTVSTTYVLKTTVVNPADEPPQNKRQFRFFFDGQDMLFTYSFVEYMYNKPIWCYEGVTKIGEKVIAKVSAEKGYVRNVSYENLSGMRSDFDYEDAKRNFLSRLPNIGEIKSMLRFVRSKDYDGKGSPFIDGCVNLTDQNIAVRCNWSGAVYDGVFRIRFMGVTEDVSDAVIEAGLLHVVEESALDFIYPRWV